MRLGRKGKKIYGLGSLGKDKILEKIIKKAKIPEKKDGKK